MTTPSTLWGDIRSMLATPNAASLAEVIKAIHQSAPPQDELDAMVEHLARGLQQWPESIRVGARLPYVPWLHQLCERALIAEAIGDEPQRTHLTTLIEAFKPDAIPALAIEARQRVRQHVNQHGWSGLPFEQQQTTEAFAALGKAAHEHPERVRVILRKPPMYRDGYPFALRHLFERVCIYGPADSGEYFWATVSRADALDGICALQVLLEHFPSRALSQALVDYCWDICLNTIYPESYKAGYSKTLSRPAAFVDLNRMLSRPFMGGFAAPIFQQDGLIQVILSGMKIYQQHAQWNARELSDAWQGLERLATFESLGDDALWASDGTHWDAARLHAIGQSVVARLDLIPGAKFHENEYQDRDSTASDLDDWDEWDEDDWEE